MEAAGLAGLLGPVAEAAPELDVADAEFGLRIVGVDEGVNLAALECDAERDGTELAEDISRDTQALELLNERLAEVWLPEGDELAGAILFDLLGE